MDPFLNAASIGPGVSRGPAFSVNRDRKGDRLPLHPSRTIWREFRVPDGRQSQQRVPLGCDLAFSPVTSPALSKVYGRCMA